VDRRRSALGGQFDAMPEPGDSLEDEPGFWGRLFKRKSKERDSEQFRRYPAPDLSGRTRPLPNLSSEPTTETLPKATPPEPPVKTPPMTPVTLRREIVRPVAPAEPPSSWTEGPVVVERTIQVPIALAPEEARRGAILKLTLEVVIDGSRSQRDHAA
jgi:hypothetical protein